MTSITEVFFAMAQKLRHQRSVIITNHKHHVRFPCHKNVRYSPDLLSLQPPLLAPAKSSASLFHNRQKRHGFNVVPLFWREHRKLPRFDKDHLIRLCTVFISVAEIFDRPMHNGKAWVNPISANLRVVVLRLI